MYLKQTYSQTRAVFGFGGSRVWQFSGMAVVVVIHIMVLSKTVLNVNVCVSNVVWPTPNPAHFVLTQGYAIHISLLSDYIFWYNFYISCCSVWVKRRHSGLPSMHYSLALPSVTTSMFDKHHRVSIYLNMACKAHSPMQTISWFPIFYTFFSSNWSI